MQLKIFHQPINQKCPQQGKPYSEYRVGITSEQDPAKRAILQDAIGQAKQESAKRIKSAVEDARKNATTGQRIERFLRTSNW